MNRIIKHPQWEQVKTKKNMKRILIIMLITLWAFVNAKAQSNYFITSVADIEITERGSGLLTNQYLVDTSEVATSQRFWFLSPKGYDQGSGQWYQAGMLNVSLRNLSSSQFKKVSLYDFTGTNLLYTQNIAPNASISFDFSNNRRLDASKDYYWKFENVASQTPSCVADTKNIPASDYDYINVLTNDLNLPNGADCRLKAGQSLSGGLTVIKDQFTGLKVTTSSQQGSFSFVYEVVSSSGTVLAEGIATIVVGASSQYCTLAILSEQLQSGSQTIHEFNGTLWVNMGDSYVGSANNGGKDSKIMDGTQAATGSNLPSKRVVGLKSKDLIGIPWMLAFALRADGWYLRQEIIWAKPNPMPESVTDRCTKSHESIFLLAKSPSYYCDMGAIKERAVSDHAPGNTSHKGATAYAAEEGEHHRTKSGLVAYAERQRAGKGGKNAFRGQGHQRDGDNGPANREGRDMQDVGASETRNKRSVWTVATTPYRGAHFATFPTALIEPCILAGAPAGGVVLDPFFGSGTTGAVAQALGRKLPEILSN